MGFHPLSPGSQKMGEYLVTSVLCLELFLESSRLTKNSRTLLCPLWTSGTQGPTLSEWERCLRAGPA